MKRTLNLPNRQSLLEQSLLERSLLERSLLERSLLERSLLNSRFIRLLLAMVVVLPAMASAQYQIENSRYPDPSKCVLVVEDMGSVGFRIADAQGLAERAVTAFRSRLGQDAVVYGGMLKHALDMQRRLRGTETEIQNEQIDYYSAAAKAAEWTVRVRFGRKGKKHWVKATCHRVKEGKKQKKATETRKWVGKKFMNLKDDFQKEMKTFCLEVDPPVAKKAVDPAGAQARTKQKKKKAWSLPPMRR